MMKFHIGAGTIITVLLALAIGGFALYQQRRIAVHPPVIERVVQGSTGAGITPVPEFLIRHRQELALDAIQVQRIGRIAAAYRHDIAPIRTQMNSASTEYHKKMERSQPGVRYNLQQLQNAGGAVMHLSSVLVATRQTYWRQARLVLTSRQQLQVDHLVSKATLQDLQ